MPDSNYKPGEARRMCAEMIRRFMQAVTEGDGAAVADLYTAEAVLLPEGQEMIKGRPAIETYWRSAFASGMKDVVLTTAAFSGEGDYRYEIGRVDITLEPEGRESMILFGKYVAVWKRTPDGFWKIDTDIWNLNQPM